MEDEVKLTEEETEKRIAFLEAHYRKWKYIVSLVFSVLMILLGTGVIPVGILLGYYWLCPIGVAAIILGVLYVVFNVKKMKKCNEYREELVALRKTNEPKPIKKADKSEERILIMKLYSESKISKEEFDKMMKDLEE